MKRSSSVTAKVDFCRSCSSTTRMRQARRPVEGGERAVEAPLPAVRARERGGRRPVGGRERGQRAQALALARRGLERPGQRGERAAPCPALDLVGREQAARLVPERARLARRAVVARGLADEVEPARRSRAGGVEEVAVARDRVGAQQAPGARGALELGLLLLVEERRALRAARQAALVEADDEDDLEAAGARPQQVEHRHAAGLAGATEPHRGVGEQRDDLLAARSPPRSRQPSSSATSFDVASCARRSSRAASWVGGASAVARRARSSCARGPERGQRVGGAADGVEVRQRLAAQLRRPPPRPAPAASRRGRAAGPRGSRRGGAPAPSTASAGTRTARAAAPSSQA